MPKSPFVDFKAIKAAITDQIVWNQPTRLMTSPELMRNQVERWMNNRFSASTVTPP